MNAQIEAVAELSVAQLFSRDQYQIPLYQRNYAWTSVEVEQLLNDILDMALHHQDQPYYIGSLVVHQREAFGSGHTLFETIDGQQRHTTLSIILAALKKGLNRPFHDIEKTNLCFEARESSSRTLGDLFSGARSSVSADTDSRDTEDKELSESAMLAAYNTAVRFFKKALLVEEAIAPDSPKSNDRKLPVTEFTRYLLEKVTILRVVVPKKTDLNHYFEIMNNRGEQLEKHEVLKARLLGAMVTGSDLEHERTAFAAVWDACAEMDRYLQLGIKSGIRDKVFGGDWNGLPENFDALVNCFKPEAANESKTEVQVNSGDSPPTLAKILQGARRHDLKDPRDEKDSPERFHSIINFPNFLLQVLKLYAQKKDCRKDVPLDDKQLLKAFDRIQPEPKSFLMLLLKCRFLFDRYVIKRDGEKGWALKKLTVYRNQKKVNTDYNNSYSDSVFNKRLEMLQAMFHVTYTSQNYKNWLQATLRYLEQQNASELNGQGYEQFLEGLSDRFLRNYLLVEGSGNALDLGRLNLGTSVANFIFNRLDYKLWLLLSNINDSDLFHGFQNQQKEYILQRWQTFRFTQRSSVEHFHPQHGLARQNLKGHSGNDTFGNLCLIDSRLNAKLNNYSAADKKRHLENKTLESLKLLFMMSYEHWGPEHRTSIQAHEIQMIKVLLDGLDSSGV